MHTFDMVIPIDTIEVGLCSCGVNHHRWTKQKTKSIHPKAPSSPSAGKLLRIHPILAAYASRQTQI